MTIAVYGATGYQAGLVLAEMAARGLRPVLVGRDGPRLGAAAAAAGLPDAECRVAPIEHDALVAAFAGCRVVLNCAGPFTPTGAAVVRAAIAAGCHCTDTAGEQAYVAEVFDAFAGPAQRAGVGVVPAANDGAVPTDLLAHLLAQRVGSVAEVVFSHLISGGGGPSRGSLRSVARTAAAIATGGLEHRDGGWHPGRPARRTVTDADGADREMMRFPLVEVVTVPRHVPAARVEALAEAQLGAALATPLTDAQIAALPAGPGAADRRGQRFTYLVDVRGTDGRSVRGVVRGADTYGATAVIAVEVACRLAGGGAPAGVLAPAQAFDPADLLAHLATRGISTEVRTGVRTAGAAVSG